MARVTPLFRYERASGLLMIGAIALALLIANSPVAGWYNALHHTPVHFRIGGLIIDRPLAGWINKGLMVFFFLAVGLEIKRQFMEGHLSSPRQAALPAFAAVGGMALPALIYAAFNWNDPVALKGWAIPTATDIVLALGVLSILGDRVPAALRIFLTALAVFDDVGAVLIVGLFYSHTISLAPLAVAALAIAGLAALNARRATRVYPFVLAGLVLWVGMLKAGVEASLAGIVIALAVPLRAPGCACTSPLRETLRRLHPWCALVIVPLFAFFNAGVLIDEAVILGTMAPVSLGIVSGFFVGKPLGVLGASWIAVRLGLGQLPCNIGWRDLYGVALLAGIGFTMSLFVTSLVFDDPTLASSARLAILIGSALSTVIGLCQFRARFISK